MTVNLDIRFSPGADLYFLLRRDAELNRDAEWNVDLTAFRAAFPTEDVMRPMFLDPGFAAMCDGEGLTAGASGLPGAGGLPLGELARAMGAVIEAAQPGYDGLPADRRAGLEGAIASRIDPVRRNIDQCVAEVIDIFELDLPPGLTVPVLMVDDVHPVGGITSTDVADQPVSVVSVTHHAGNELAEAIVHEVTHGLVMVDQSAEQPLIQLMRSAPPERHQLWHVPLFLTAAELIRRHIDADHVDYGTSHRYYAGCPLDYEIAARWWPRRLSGELNLSQVCLGMLAEAA